jgi:quinol-cytochrome oxidoreductase complex cytochrome b subunit
VLGLDRATGTKLVESSGVEEPSASEHVRGPAAGTGGILGERLAWGALRYPIPATANRLPYMLGGLTLVGVVVLIATGLVMDQFYDPDPLAAHDSVLYIITQVPLGSWIRALHYWAATVVMVSVVCHLYWVLWRRSYLRPRELTWWSGVLLLILLFGLTFTGTVLRGDQEGTEALAHAVAAADLLGPAGSVLSPEFARSTSLLSRLHNAHVSLLPLLLLALVGSHFWLIRHHGIHAQEPRTSVFTRHLQRLSGYGLLLIAGLGAIALAFPPGIGYPGVEGIEVTKPFWPFLWIYAAESTIGLWGMLLAPALLFAFLLLVPLMDRNDDAGGRPPWLFGLFNVFWALYVLGLIYGFFAPVEQHIGM